MQWLRQQRPRVPFLRLTHALEGHRHAHAHQRVERVHLLRATTRSVRPSGRSIVSSIRLLKRKCVPMSARRCVTQSTACASARTRSTATRCKVANVCAFARSSYFKGTRAVRTKQPASVGSSSLCRVDTSTVDTTSVFHIASAVPHTVATTRRNGPLTPSSSRRVTRPFQRHTGWGGMGNRLRLGSGASRSRANRSTPSVSRWLYRNVKNVAGVSGGGCVGHASYR